MRILEFHPGGYRNLSNQPIIFTLDSEQPLREACSIRFLVGANGAGKTNILRFLAGIFLALEENFRRPNPQNPAYSVPFVLKYELRKNIIILDSKGRGRSGLQVTINNERREAGDLPSRDQILPQTVLVYTSGNITEWRTLSAALPNELQADETEFQHDQLRLEEEVQPESLNSPSSAKPILEGDVEEKVDPDAVQENILSSRIYLAEPSHLKLALLATLLDLQTRQAQEPTFASAFLQSLEEINVRLLSFSGLFSFKPERPPTPQQRTFLSTLYDLATLQLAVWERQRWIYDLSHVSASRGQSTLAALHEALLNDPFQFFQMLVSLQRAGYLDALDLVIRYIARHDPRGETARTLLSNGLSDGQFSFLARMALVYLLKEEECLFLLDEPEVHFNDDWKRNLVNSIEQALQGTHSEVILTSHASITLTDAFPDEVILLGDNGQILPVPLTLGAEPGEILRRLFNSERTVGVRAMHYIEEKIKNGTVEELNQLLDEVGTGFYRFKIVEELQRRVSQNQPS